MEFSTDRIIIRKPIVDDAEDIFRNYAADAEVTRYITWQPHRSVQDSVDWIKFCIANFDTSKFMPFYIFYKDTKQTIGSFDFRIQGTQAILGYVLSKKYWNKGIMVEAVRPVLDSILARKDIYRVSATHDVENVASGKVMQKLGMQLEGILRKYVVLPNISTIPRDMKIYSIVK